MSRSERAFNCLFGLSLCSWAILGLVSELPRPWLVQVTISAMHLCVGLLILVRQPVVHHGSVAAAVSCLPSLAAGGLALRWTPTVWASSVQIAFCLSGFWTIFSLVVLGRSFAVLPAVRSTVSRGAYAFVRHPAYLGELLMLACCAVATGTIQSAVLLLVSVGGMALRISIEERVLAVSSDYESYRQQVRWRLLPWVW